MSYNPGPSIGPHVLTSVVSLFFGYLFGWAANENPEYNLICIFIMFGFGYAMKKAREMHMNDIISRSELARVHIEEEMKLVKEQSKNIQAQAKTQIEYPFTSENFDRDAQGLLLQIIQKAKKQKHKVVSGALLVTELLKSIR